MKRSILPLAFWLSLFLTLPAHGDTLEYRIAVIGSAPGWGQFELLLALEA